MGKNFTCSVKTLAISIVAAIFAIVVACVIEFVSPTIFTVGGPYAISNPPPPGTLYTTEELNRAEAEAKANIKQLHELLPKENITISGYMKVALTSQYWVLAFLFVVVAYWFRNVPAIPLVFTAIPFVSLVIPNWLSVGQILFFPLVVSFLLVFRSKGPNIRAT